MTAVRWAASSDVGRSRQLNEDAFFAGDRIFAVADGLGGHRAGEVASQIAIECVSSLDHSRTRDLAAALEDSVRRANHDVHERQSKNPAEHGMSTTITAIAVEDGVAHLAHVGDSRCYLFREGQISLVSRDHTLVARLVDEGTITEEEATVHPQRSIVTRAVGADDSVQIDTLELGLATGDRLLLCSDGLSAVVPAGEIETALRDEKDPQQVCDRLVGEANRRGGPDNITVIVVDVDDAPVRAKPPAKPELRPRRHFFTRRFAVWAAVVVLVIAGGWIGLRTWVNHSWYVGSSKGTVAIFRGLPVEVAGISLHHPVKTTGIKIDQVAPYYRPRLKEGIRAGSLADAERIVRELIPRVPTPVPAPSGTPSPTGTGKGHI